MACTNSCCATAHLRVMWVRYTGRQHAGRFSVKMQFGVQLLLCSRCVVCRALAACSALREASSTFARSQSAYDQAIKQATILRCRNTALLTTGSSHVICDSSANLEHRPELSMGDSRGLMAATYQQLMRHGALAVHCCATNSVPNSSVIRVCSAGSGRYRIQNLPATGCCLANMTEMRNWLLLTATLPSASFAANNDHLRPTSLTCHVTGFANEQLSARFRMTLTRNTTQHGPICKCCPSHLQVISGTPPLV